MEESSVQHLGTKVRYSVQQQSPRTGEWRDLNQDWPNAKLHPFSVTRTIEGARAWKVRAEKAWKRNLVPAGPLRIVKVVTEYTEVQ